MFIGKHSRTKQTEICQGLDSVCLYPCMEQKKKRKETVQAVALLTGTQ